MVHKFDEKNRRKLDSSKRREILPPFDILNNLGVNEGDIIADIGCGIGYFTFPACDIVGKSGKVFAMDISAKMLEEVDKKLEESSTPNIVTILTEADNLKIPAGVANYAFMSHVLHEVENKEKLLNEAFRIIANGGRIGIVEWQKVESEFGPPLEHRLDEKYVEGLLQNTGFKNISIKRIGEYFYSITGEK